MDGVQRARAMIMTHDELSAQLKSLAPNETLDVRDDLLAELLPDRSDGYIAFASERECRIEDASDELSTRFVKVARESISEQDRAAIDRFYEYAGYGYRGLGWYSDVDRRDHMDFKDRVRKQGQDELFPVQVSLVGFGAVAILFTPFAWIAPIVVAVGISFKGLIRRLRTHRTLVAYGRKFAFDRNGVVIDATRVVDPARHSAAA